MGRPPAYIFVVRHGTRLDAADKQWHLSSPTPYDPPLTYGGWQQSRALGAKIGAILGERIREENSNSSNQGPQPANRRRRKYKVVIHSSPFLRCIQTSVGISAGLAQDPPTASVQTSRAHTPQPTSSPRQDIKHPGRPALASLRTTSDETEVNSEHGLMSAVVHKTVLRLDAFLGEWLSPSYFELITPPPESVMMLASAKAQLLTREDYTNYPGFAAHVHSSSQCQLPSGPTISSAAIRPPPGTGASTAPNNVASLATSLSLAPPQGSGSQTSERSGYVAPVPNYAISSSATIPLGYVSHAKDACVEVDYQWDSMRGPLEWGDGGTYGEEWTSMHRRFRKGIQNLVDWYTTAENPTAMVTKTSTKFESKGSNGADEIAVEDDDDATEPEAVVILVSHGAGCNALIGAITHQPVLTDVGMASLTMAVRKPGKSHFEPDSAISTGSNGSTFGPKGLVAIHEYYDLKLFASMEHLRTMLGISRSPSAAQAAQGARGRPFNSVSSSIYNTFGYHEAGGSRSSSANAVMSTARRGSNTSTTGSSPRAAWTGTSPRGGITVGSGATSFTGNNNRIPSGLARTPSIGLWSPVSQYEEQPIDDEEEDDMLLNFSPQSTLSSSSLNAAPLPPSEEAAAPGLEPSANATSAPIDIPSPSHRSDPATINVDSITVAPPPPLLEDREPERFSSSSLSRLGVGPGGLWGSVTPSPPQLDRIRDLASMKRRWTVNERA